MNNSTLSVLKSLHNLYHLPIWYSDLESTVAFVPFFLEKNYGSVLQIQTETLKALRKYNEKTDKPVFSAFYLHPSMTYWGVSVNEKESTVIFIGPIAGRNLNSGTLEPELFKNGMDAESIAIMRQYLEQSEEYTSGNFKDLLVITTAILNNCAYSAEDIISVELSATTIPENISSKVIKDISNDEIAVNPTIIESFNMRLALAMLSGDTSKLTGLLSDANVVFKGIDDYEDLEEERLSTYGAIYAIENIAKHAGLSGSIIEQPKHFYLHKIAASHSVDDIRMLSVKAMYEFTDLIAIANEKKIDNPFIQRAVKYIDANIHTKLTAEIIASAINCDTHYLFTHFKEEMNTTLSNYITEKKIKKACDYMAYTDKSLSEIASFLSFSSQSYFQTVFKKTMGATPEYWRNNNK